jgi:hypothetical protein
MPGRHPGATQCRQKARNVGMEHGSVDMEIDDTFGALDDRPGPGTGV